MSVYTFRLEVAGSKTFEHMTLFQTSQEVEFNPRDMIVLPTTARVKEYLRIGTKNTLVHVLEVDGDTFVIKKWHALFNEPMPEDTIEGWFPHITVRGEPRPIGHVFTFDKLGIKQVGPHNPIIKFQINPFIASDGPPPLLRDREDNKDAEAREMPDLA